MSGTPSAGEAEASVNREQGRRCAATLCAAALLLVAACGADPPGHDPAGPASSGPASPADPVSSARELTVGQATQVLAAFDRSDSAASVSGNITALRADEAAPALDDSLAAVYRARASHAKQAPYNHADPVFAIPAGNPGCLLAAATLRSGGGEIPENDVSQFTRGPSGTWKLDLHVLVGPSTGPELASIGAQPATLTATAIGAARRQALVSQLFARTTATPHPDLSLVASSVVLDQQLGMGWTLYRQGLRAGHMALSREMTGSQWSACAARAGSSLVAFVTIDATDTITPLPGGPPTAELTTQDPDLIGLGRHTAVRGASIKISRVEEFLLSVPAAASAPAAVLGLIDAPVSLTAGAR
jgi:hypothetical protein